MIQVIKRKGKEENFNLRKKKKDESRERKDNKIRYKERKKDEIKSRQLRRTNRGIEKMIKGEKKINNTRSRPLISTKESHQEKAVDISWGKILIYAQDFFFFFSLNFSSRP